LRDEKTNKTDTDLQMKGVDILHKQILQLSTIVLEIIKFNVTTKLETETERQQKFKFLLQQEAHLVDWIAGFDPENVNSRDLHLPKELKPLQHYSQNLVRLLPEFLSQTVSHRLKQVA